MASSEIRRYRNLGNFVSDIDQRLTAVQNRNNLRGVAAASIDGSHLSGNITLEDTSLQSPDYITGSSGWRIGSDGAAEFASATIRGNINATSGTIGVWNLSSQAIGRTFDNVVATVTSVSGNGIYATYTANNSFYIGDYVTIQGITPDTYNLYNAQITYANATVFKVATTVADAFVSVANATAQKQYYGTFIENVDLGYADSDILSGAYVGLYTSYDLATSGLYVKDYARSYLDHAYFSSDGVRYVSAEKINILYNPSFEYNSEPSIYGWRLTGNGVIKSFDYAQTPKKVAMITGAVVSGSNIVYTAANDFAVGDVLEILGVRDTVNTTGADNTGFNYDSATVTAVTGTYPNQTAFTVVKGSNAPGTYLTTSQGLAYTQTTTELTTWILGTSTVSGGGSTSLVTYTTTTSNNLKPGDLVSISGTSGANTSYSIVSVNSVTSNTVFTVVPGGVATSGTGGTVKKIFQSFSTQGSLFGGQTTFTNASPTAYMVGTLDIATARNNGIFDADRPLYFNLHIYENSPLFAIQTTGATAPSATISFTTATVTISTFTPHGLSVNDLVYIDESIVDSVTNESYVPANGVAVVASVPTTTSFTYAITMVNTTSVGTLNVSASVNKDGTTRPTAIYKVYYPAIDLKEIFLKFPTANTYTVTAASNTGSTVTYTANNHSFKVGDSVAILGTSTNSADIPASGLFKVSAANTTTFTVVSNAATSGFGNATAYRVAALYDVINLETKNRWDGDPVSVQITNITVNNSAGGSYVTFTTNQSTFAEDSAEEPYYIRITGLTGTYAALNADYSPTGYGTAANTYSTATLTDTSITVQYSTGLGTLTSGIPAFGLATLLSDDRISPAHYLTMDPGVYAPEYLDPTIGITAYNYAIGGVDSLPVISSSKLDAVYSTIDPAGYANNTPVNLYIPTWQYLQPKASLGNNTTFPTYLDGDVLDGSTWLTQPSVTVKKYATANSAYSIGILFDDAGFSTSNKSFYGDQGSIYSWSNPTAITAEQSSIQEPIHWIDVDLKNQVAQFNGVDYIGFASKYFSKTLNQPASISVESTTYQAIQTNLNDSEVLRLSSGEQTADAYWNGSAYTVYNESYSSLGITENNPTTEYGSIANWVDEPKYNGGYYRQEKATLSTGIYPNTAAYTTLTASRYNGSLYAATISLKVDKNSNSPATSIAMSAAQTTMGGRVLLTSAGDVTLTSTNHAFQIGVDSGQNLRIDQNEIQSVNNGVAANLSINASGGVVLIGPATSSTTQLRYSYGYNTAISGRAVQISSNGTMGYLSSTLRSKQDIAPLSEDVSPETILQIEPKKFKYKADVEELGEENVAFRYGFIAEDLDSLGLKGYVYYGEDGSIDGIDYAAYVSALQLVAKMQQSQIADLTARIEKLEGK